MQKPTIITSFETDNLTIPTMCKTIDLGVRSDRMWLINYMMWALNHNLYVTMTPQGDFSNTN